MGYGSEGGIMRRRKIELRKHAYVVLDDDGNRLSAYVTQSAAIRAASDALALLGGGVVTLTDGSELQVDADPRLATTA